MPKNKREKRSEQKVHEELDGLTTSISSFGEIKVNLPIDKINDFLNKHVEDKKLVNRDDLKKS